MVFSPIQIAPGTDGDTLANAINENFQQIASQDRSRTISDESGTPRIIIGKSPKGNYGLYISKPGVDVKAELERG